MLILFTESEGFLRCSAIHSALLMKYPRFPFPLPFPTPRQKRAAWVEAAAGGIRSMKRFEGVEDKCSLRGINPFTALL